MDKRGKQKPNTLAQHSKHHEHACSHHESRTLAILGKHQDAEGNDQASCDLEPKERGRRPRKHLAEELRAARGLGIGNRKDLAADEERIDGDAGCEQAGKARHEIAPQLDKLRLL